MASWSVYEPPGTDPGSFASADESVFVGDGWSWGALLVPPIWLIWRRMWLVFLGWLAVALAFGLAETVLNAGTAVTGWGEALFALWFALEANALRRWTLARKGWRFAGIATGSGRIDAEHRFFGRRDTASAEPGFVPGPASGARGPAPARTEAVLGIFPEPFGSRR
jgi:hypothetical protein